MIRLGRLRVGIGGLGLRWVLMRRCWIGFRVRRCRRCMLLGLLLVLGRMRLLSRCGFIGWLRRLVMPVMMTSGLSM